jgi:hypothetical protein
MARAKKYEKQNISFYKRQAFMEEYITVNELSSRIKFSRQSLYNLIHKGTFILGKHYLKPTPKKVLFKWSEIMLWMGDALSLEKDSGSGKDTVCQNREEAGAVDNGVISKINI